MHSQNLLLFGETEFQGSAPPIGSGTCRQNSALPTRYEAKRARGTAQRQQQQFLESTRIAEKCGRNSLARMCKSKCKSFWVLAVH